LRNPTLKLGPWLASTLVGLRQRDAVRLVRLLVPSYAVRHQCGGKIDLQYEAVGSRNASLDGTALVECSRSSRLEDCDGLPLSP